MQVISAFITDTQATKLMQPRERALHDPAIDSQAATVRRETSGQHRLNAQAPQPSPMRFRVIGAVTLQALGAPTRATPFTPHGRDGCDQRLKLSDVIRVRTCQASRQRDAVGIGEDVVFASRLGFIRGIRASFGPPFRARSEALSTTARDQSIRFASRSLANKTSCSRCQTPAACQSPSRRQHVMPLPRFGPFC